MKSQKIGRQTRRFFVLRDHYLSYHKDKPTNEEEVSTFNANTLLLTEDTSIQISRKLLTRCLTITTPSDTLWIKLKNDQTQDIVRWCDQLNKSLQFLQRRK
jgi:hypothetical protein